MQDEIDAVKGPSLDAQKLHMQAQEAKQSAALIVKEQVASEESMMAFAELGSEFNPLAMGKEFKELNKRAEQDFHEQVQQAQEDEEAHSASTQKTAEAYAKKNPELNSRALLLLKSFIKPDDTLDAILTKVRNSYPDPALADEALDFLIETSGKGSSVEQKLVNTKNQFNEVFGREIRAGRNIQQEAQSFSKSGLGSPTALRDLYRDITGNQERPMLYLMSSITSLHSRR